MQSYIIPTAYNNVLSWQFELAVTQKATSLLEIKSSPIIIVSPCPCKHYSINRSYPMHEPSIAFPYIYAIFTLFPSVATVWQREKKKKLELAASLLQALLSLPLIFLENLRENHCHGSQSIYHRLWYSRYSQIKIQLHSLLFFFLYISDSLCPYFYVMRELIKFSELINLILDIFF